MFLFNFFIALFLFLFPGKVFAEYVPLITSTTFDGVRVDVTTTAVGLISILVIVVGVSLIARTFSR